MMRRTTLRLFAAALAASALSGCAQHRLGPADSAVERQAVAHFEVEGRIAASDGQQAANGRMVWAHGPRHDEWTLFSPLGQIVARLERGPDGARLRTADGTLTETSDPDSLMPHLLGVPAPLDALPDWIQATPQPPARVLELDAHGRPARISDHGWIIDYPEYADDSPQALPHRIDARWGDARLRIVVDTWTLPE